MKFIPRTTSFETKEDFEKYEKETTDCIAYFEKENEPMIVKGLRMVEQAYLQWKAEQIKKYPWLLTE